MGEEIQKGLADDLPRQARLLLEGGIDVEEAEVDGLSPLLDAFAEGAGVAHAFEEEAVVRLRLAAFGDVAAEGQKSRRSRSLDDAAVVEAGAFRAVHLQRLLDEGLPASAEGLVQPGLAEGPALQGGWATARLSSARGGAKRHRPEGEKRKTRSGRLSTRLP